MRLTDPEPAPAPAVRRGQGTRLRSSAARVGALAERRRSPGSSQVLQIQALRAAVATTTPAPHSATGCPALELLSHLLPVGRGDRGVAAVRALAGCPVHTAFPLLSEALVRCVSGTSLFRGAPAAEPWSGRRSRRQVICIALARPPSATLLSSPPPTQVSASAQKTLPRDGGRCWEGV